MTRRFSEFLLIFTSKSKMNFRSLFKCLVDFMQLLVLSIALESIFNDLEKGYLIHNGYLILNH